MSAKAVKKADVAELPRQAQVGDRIRLKPEKAFAYSQACESVGWTLRADEVRVVLREDKFLPGGGRRLFFDGPPFCFAANDVELAWRNDNERRAMLRSRGWKV